MVAFDNKKRSARGGGERGRSWFVRAKTNGERVEENGEKG